MRIGIRKSAEPSLLLVPLFEAFELAFPTETSNEDPTPHDEYTYYCNLSKTIRATLNIRAQQQHG